MAMMPINKSMMANWKLAWKHSEIFKVYFLLNLAALDLSLLALWIWADADVYAVTLFTYAIGMAFPIGLDLLRNNPPIPMHQKTESFVLGICFFFVILIVPQANKTLSIALSMLMCTIILYIWGGTYAYDSKMDVPIANRGDFTNSGASQQPLHGNKDRDVEI